MRRPAPTRRWRWPSCSRRRRGCWRSAACRAAARPRWRSGWRPRSAARRAPSWCAATSSASARQASPWRSACRPAATRRRLRPGSMPPVLARAERVLRAGHSVVLDAVFAREDERVAAEALARQGRRAVRGHLARCPEGGGAGARGEPQGRRIGRHAGGRRAPVRLRPGTDHVAAASWSCGSWLAGRPRDWRRISGISGISGSRFRCAAPS